MLYYIRMKYYIVGASEFAEEKFHPEDDAVVIAADAGMKYVGKRADLAIGDWDSLHRYPENVQAVTLPVVKDYTDTGEAVDHALNHDATEIVMFGTSGGRVDHYLANLQYLVMIADRGVKASMVCPDCTIYAMAEGEREFYGKGSIISVIPMRERVVVSISGVQYPLKKHLMPEDNPGLGVSNVIEAECARITVHEGIVLVIVND